MTFDFTEHWFQAPASSTSDTTSAQPFTRSPATVARAPCAPAYPSVDELADLVQELFTEGTLTWEQLQAFAAQADLRPALQTAMDSIPQQRRLK